LDNRGREIKISINSNRRPTKFSVERDYANSSQEWQQQQQQVSYAPFIFRPRLSFPFETGRSPQTLFNHWHTPSTRSERHIEYSELNNNNALVASAQSLAADWSKIINKRNEIFKHTHQSKKTPRPRSGEKNRRSKK